MTSQMLCYQISSEKNKPFGKEDDGLGAVEAEHYRSACLDIEHLFDNINKSHIQKQRKYKQGSIM